MSLRRQLSKDIPSMSNFSLKWKVKSCLWKGGRTKYSPNLNVCVWATVEPNWTDLTRPKCQHLIFRLHLDPMGWTKHGPISNVHFWATFWQNWPYQTRPNSNGKFMGYICTKLDRQNTVPMSTSIFELYLDQIRQTKQDPNWKDSRRLVDYLIGGHSSSYTTLICRTNI